MPEEFIQVGICLPLSIPQEIWLQGTSYKPDELFWQVQFVMPAQLIFRGFPISLNTNIIVVGFCLFVDFVDCGNLGSCS